MRKTNSNFEKFENTVNLIYTVCPMSEMMTWTMFTTVSMGPITGVEISKKQKMCKTKSGFEKFQNAVNLIYTVCAMLEMMIWSILP